MYLSYDEFLEDTYEKDLQNAKTLLYDTNECITNHGYTCSKERFIYPEFQHNGLGLDGTRYKVHRKIHRIVYELIHNVKLSKEQFVCHKCNNPECINPKHLFLGDAKINRNDCKQKQRDKNSIVYRKGKESLHYKNGIYSKYDSTKYPTKFKEHYSRKLSKEQVSNLKKDLIIGNYTTYFDLAKKYNVNENVIRDVASGRTYKSVIVDVDDL